MDIKLNTPVVVVPEQTTTTLVVTAVTEDYAQNRVVARTNLGRFILWEGDVLDALNDREEQWTDADVEARILELLASK